MANKLANNATQAMQWATKGSFGGIMPVQENTSSGKANGTIIGVRKATIWDHIKVTLTYSKEEKAALAKAKSIGLAQMIWKDQPVRSGSVSRQNIDQDGRTIRIAAAGSEGGHALSHLFKKKALSSALSRGLFPVSHSNAVVVQEPSGKKLPKGELDPTVKKNLKAAQKWIYTYRDNAAPATRRYLDAQGVKRTGKNTFERVGSDKNTAGATGWTPSREVGRFKATGNPGLAINATDWGQFSTIISRKSEIVPRDFPQTFTDTNDHYDDKGYLIPAAPIQWTLLERDEADLNKGVAKYVTFTESGEEIVRQFAKEELISHPRNLILEHTGGAYAGYTTIWMVVPDEKVLDNKGRPALHWVRSTFDKDGDAVNTYNQFEDGSYDIENPAIKGKKNKFISAKDMSCQDPFTFVSKLEDRMDKKAQSARLAQLQAKGHRNMSDAEFKQFTALTAKGTLPTVAKTRFANETTHVKYSENRPTIEIGNKNVAKVAIENGWVKHGTEDLKDHNEVLSEIAPKYEAKFNAVLRHGIDVLQERLAEIHAKQDNGTATQEEIEEAIVIFGEHIPELERVQENRNIAKTKKLVAADYPKGLQLTPHPALNDFITNAYEAKVASGRASYKVGKDSGENELGEKVKKGKRHVFTPTLYQAQNWKAQALDKYEDMTSEWLDARSAITKASEDEQQELAITLAAESGEPNVDEIIGDDSYLPEPTLAHIAHWSVTQMAKDASTLARAIEQESNELDVILEQLADMGLEYTDNQYTEGAFKQLYMSYVNTLAMLRAHNEHLEVLSETYPTIKGDYIATYGEPLMPFNRQEGFRAIQAGARTVANTNIAITQYENVIPNLERRVGGLDNLLVARGQNQSMVMASPNASRMPSPDPLSPPRSLAPQSLAPQAIDEEDYVPAQSQSSAEVEYEDPALVENDVYVPPAGARPVEPIYAEADDDIYMEEDALGIILPPPEQFVGLPGLEIPKAAVRAEIKPMLLDEEEDVEGENTYMSMNSNSKLTDVYVEPENTYESISDVSENTYESMSIRSLTPPGQRQSPTLRAASPIPSMHTDEENDDIGSAADLLEDLLRIDGQADDAEAPEPTFYADDEVSILDESEIAALHSSGVVPK